MIQYGKNNTLVVGRRSENGFYLQEAGAVPVEGGTIEEVLLPKKFAIPGMKEGKEMHVSFVICEALIVILISIILIMMLFYILILCISKSLGVW